MSRTFSLPYDVNGPALARRYVEEFAAEQMLDGATPVLHIVVTELVENAVVHGAEPVELTLHRQDGEVTVQVADGDPKLDGVRRPFVADARRSGNGLHLVTALAQRWGTRSSPTGKTVWATIDVTHE